MIETFIIKEKRFESEKIIEYGIKMQTKTESYLDSKFNLHSYKSDYTDHTVMIQISLAVSINYTEKS